MASFGDKGLLASSVDGKYGENLRVRGADEEIDLGPYSGPTFTVTPIILGDGSGVDLAMQATVFWRLEEPAGD